jgi:hypothetical protein
MPHRTLARKAQLLRLQQRRVIHTLEQFVERSSRVLCGGSIQLASKTQKFVRLDEQHFNNMRALEILLPVAGNCQVILFEVS